MSIEGDIQKLAPGRIVELFELDCTSVGGTVLRFHNGVNELGADVVWQGQTYVRFPIEATGFEFNGKGQLPRPTLRVANVTGLLGALVRTYQDLIGCKLTRRRTLVKYLDEVNFPDRRNLFLHTDNLSSWFSSASQCSVVSNAGLSPTGELAADLLRENTSNGYHYLDRNQPFGATGIFTMSAQLKPAGRNAFMGLFSAADVNEVQFNFTSGSALVTAGAGLGATAGMSAVGGGFWRCWIRAAITSTSSPLQRVGLVGNTGTLYTGDGVSGVYVSGQQLEAGSLTEYQPIGSTWSRNPTADPDAHFPDDVFFIDRKAAENKMLVEFELAAAFDVAGVQLPRRYIVQNLCPWRYRSSECGYAGAAYFDLNDSPVGSSDADVCGKRLSSCQVRFGQKAELPFGGFPAAGLVR